MSEEKKGGLLGKIGVALVLLVVLATLSTCCGCGGIVLWGPSWLVGLFVEDMPLAVPESTGEPNISTELDQRFASGGEVTLTGRELSQLVLAEADEDLAAFWMDTQGDQLTLDLSVRTEDPDGYLNVHAVASGTIEHGWFSTVSMPELVISGWDLGQYTVAQDLAPNLNQQKGQNPEFGAVIDEIEYATVQDGAIHITLKDGGYERIKAMGQGQ